MAQQGQTATSTTSTSKDDAVVRYVGTADVREITADQWKKAGVENQNKVVWNRRNRHTVKASELTQDALDVLKDDSGFKLPES